jgi:hypothetical protein
MTVFTASLLLGNIRGLQSPGGHHYPGSRQPLPTPGLWSAVGMVLRRFKAGHLTPAYQHHHQVTWCQLHTLAAHRIHSHPGSNPTNRTK